jgi:uncharacterized protein (TIGR00251 family)
LTGKVIEVHVQPGASRSEVAGLHDGRVKIRLRARAMEGQANAALIEFLATELGVARSTIRIDSGLTSRRKRVVVEGYTGELPWKMSTS